MPINKFFFWFFGLVQPNLCILGILLDPHDMSTGFYNGETSYKVCSVRAGSSFGLQDYKQYRSFVDHQMNLFLNRNIVIV